MSSMTTGIMIHLAWFFPQSHEYARPFITCLLIECMNKKQFVILYSQNPGVSIYIFTSASKRLEPRREHSQWQEGSLELS